MLLCWLYPKLNYSASDSTQLNIFTLLLAELSLRSVITKAKSLAAVCLQPVHTKPKCKHRIPFVSFFYFDRCFTYLIKCSNAWMLRDCILFSASAWQYRRDATRINKQRCAQHSFIPVHSVTGAIIHIIQYQCESTNTCVLTLLHLVFCCISTLPYEFSFSVFASLHISFQCPDCTCSLCMWIWKLP